MSNEEDRSRPDDWRQRLYDSYVTSGQAGDAARIRRPFRANEYPYFQKIVSRYLGEDRTIRILDLACGHGALVQCCQTAGFEAVSGIDVSSEQIEVACQRGAQNVSHQSITGFLAENDELFDVVFLMDVLEHLTRPELVDVLARIGQRLRKSGRLIVHVPNAAGLFGMQVRYGDLTHELAFTPRSINQLMHACGFVEVTVHEDQPVVHGFKSGIRNLMWHVMTAWPRLLLTVETGGTRHVLSQNMLVIAHGPPHEPVAAI